MIMSQTESSMIDCQDGMTLQNQELLDPRASQSNGSGWISAGMSAAK
jgi:hypothetical protein